MGVTCPNHGSCSIVTWEQDDTEALDVKVAMDEYIRDHLNGYWRRIVSKVEDDHHRTKTLRKLNKNQRKRRNQDRSRRYRLYTEKFPDIYEKFTPGYVPYTASITAGMPSLSTCSYGLYNNVNHFPEALTDSQKRYIVGIKPNAEFNRNSLWCG